MTHKKAHFFKVLVVVGYYLLVAFPLVVSAGSVTLQWDANYPTPDGYNLYQRVEDQSYDYANPVNDETITETTFIVDEIKQGVRYFFVVSALDDGEESEDSNEIEYVDMGLGGNGIDDSISAINGSSASDEAFGGCFISVGQAGENGNRRDVLLVIMAGLLVIAAALFSCRRTTLRSP